MSVSRDAFPVISQVPWHVIVHHGFFVVRGDHYLGVGKHIEKLLLDQLRGNLVAGVFVKHGLGVPVHRIFGVLMFMHKPQCVAKLMQNGTSECL